MKLPRCSGILLHPTSLPGAYGIGDLGPEAFRFADFLAEAKQGIWQVLPLGPTGYGDSPYQCFSALAGNPLLVSLERLVELGDLPLNALTENRPQFPEGHVDFGWVIQYKLPLLKKAAENFRLGASPARQDEYAEFCSKNALWLEDYALFIALKQASGDMATWDKWDPDVVARQPEALARVRRYLAQEISVQKYAQFQFFEQWSQLKSYCHERGIKMMGDIPIFVAHDSADVWAYPELFLLQSDGSLAAQAGVPPDYFSATGQLWGNPLYHWDVMA